ncbi:hypothetical protein RCL1_004384 [Eukaryota sp. TZLM3-RCL]
MPCVIIVLSSRFWRNRLYFFQVFCLLLHCFISDSLIVPLTRSASKLTKPPSKPADNVFTPSTILETPIEPSDSPPSPSISITQEITAANERIPVIDTPNASFIPDPSSSIDSRTRSLPTCSACGFKGHKRNQTVCPNYGSSFILSNDVLYSSVDLIPITLTSNEDQCSNNFHLRSEFSDGESIPKPENLVPCDCVPKISLSLCLFCNVHLPLNSSKRPQYYCTNREAVDPLRPPIRIPIPASPASALPFSMVFRSLTSKLRNGV